MRDRRLWALLLALVGLMAFAGAVAAQSEERRLYWQRYDVDITVRQNGDMRIVETQELVFTAGTFRFGQREIALNRLSNIDQVTVREEGVREYAASSSNEPYTFNAYRSSGFLNIRYNFPPTANARRTIVIGYTVAGALRYYPENGVDQLDWKALPAGNPFPVRNSTITLHLPSGATFTNYGIHGAEGAASFQQGQRDATIEVRGPIQTGQEVEVVAEWPHGIVAGQAQPWQEAVDAEAAQRAADEAFQQQWGPVLNLGFAALGGLFAIGGSLLLYLWWYRRGRDAPVGLFADYLPEPPSDLPPGVAGTLLDESADLQDILATLVDLARRGAIEIQEMQESGFLGIGAHRDFVYRLKDRSVATRKYEQILLDAVFGNRTERELSDLKNKFYRTIPQLRSELYKETVSEGLFPASPEATRSRFGCFGIAALVVAGMLGFVLVSMLAQYSGAVLCVPIGLAVPAIGMIIVARHMPRKTDQGADAAARWKAFKRYLENLEKYTKVEEAAGIFEQYLPYAIAFGLEQSWIRKFERVEAPAPTWWIPVGGPYWHPYGGRTTGGGLAGTGGGSGTGQSTSMPSEGGRPSLEGMSRGLGTSLAGMSAGLGSMLSSAGNTLTSQPSSSGGRGGGFSGGGFSGGGGGGGGGSGGGGSSFG